MNFYEMVELLDNLKSAKIYAGAEFGRLCNSKQYIEACVFQSVRDSLSQNIELLESYISAKGGRVEDFHEH